MLSLQYNLNNTLAVTIRRSPNELVYRFQPRSLLDVLYNKTVATGQPEVLDLLRRQYQEEVAELIDRAGAIAKLQYDDKYTPTRFEVGDIVYLRLYKGYYLPGKPNRKWSL